MIYGASDSRISALSFTGFEKKGEKKKCLSTPNKAATLAVAPDESVETWEIDFTQID